MYILAIDPGSTESGWVLLRSDDCRPILFGKSDNDKLRKDIVTGRFAQCDGAAIEMVASYGMAVGAEVFDTCVWIGRFTEAIRLTWAAPPEPTRVFRREVKLHHCGQTKANDSNIRQALIDRFAPGQRNYGKGTKADPGWFHGFHTDVWAAYALGVLYADRIEGRQGVAA